MAVNKITGHVNSKGEVKDGVLVLVSPKKSNGFNMGWVAMAQLPIRPILKLDMGYEALKVYLALLSYLDYENWIRVEHSKIAEDADLRTDCFSRGLRKLINLQIVERGPQKTLKLNINLCWKGTARNHKQALRKRMLERGITVY